MENHIADTLTNGFLKPSGDTAVVQFFQKAVLFVVQQVRKVILNNFLRKLLGKCLYAIPKRSVKIVLEGKSSDARERIESMGLPPLPGPPPAP